MVPKWPKPLDMQIYRAVALFRAECEVAQLWFDAEVTFAIPLHELGEPQVNAIRSQNTMLWQMR